MPHYDLEDLLKKLKNGSIEPQELDYLETWYTRWQPEQVSVSVEEILEAKARIWNKLQHKNKPHTLFYWLSSAAAVLLMAIFLWPYADLVKDSKQVSLPIVKDILPGENKAILTLAGGKKLVLGKTSSAGMLTQGAVKISLKDEGRLVYSRHNGANQSSELMNQVTTPRGGEYQLILSDGTKVWLNAASSIAFPVAFSGSNRRVTVTGEAYFEVAHDKTRPFIVSASDQQITVLGTHFNVSAYPEDEQTTTALISGLIKINKLGELKTQLVYPGQGAFTSKRRAEILIRPVNTDEVLSWKNGYFQFDNQNINTIMKIMSRWYDVDVEFLNKKNDERFGGTFSRRKNLAESLVNLEKLGKIHFKISSRKVIVSD